MRKVNTKGIVNEQKIWELCIEFIRSIDTNLVEFNLVYAYIVYLFTKEYHFTNTITNKMVFMSCFNDIGRLNANEKNSRSDIETYLFLKYFSPIKNFAKNILNDEKTIYSKVFLIAKEYTTNLIEQNNPIEAYSTIDKTDIDINIYNKLSKIIKKYDIKEELNSMHYKCIVYNLISSVIFKPRESTKLITMLASLFEMYSPQTLFHSKSCAEIAYYIAKKMKKSKVDTKKIYVAGLVHDLGKVKVPRTILEKNGKLTDLEFVEMKKHVTYTRELLGNNLDFDIIEIACRHHEKINGSGYPMHLDKDKLTENQKILQVADLVSALTGKRSYKGEWSVTDVINELTNCVNKELIDRNVYNIVVKYKNGIMSISKNSKNSANKIFDHIGREREELLKNE